MKTINALRAMATKATKKANELVGEGYTCDIFINDDFGCFQIGGHIATEFGKIVVRLKQINFHEECSVDQMVTNFFGMINNVVGPCNSLISEICSKLGIRQPES